LEAILQELKDRWDEQIVAMKSLLDDMAKAEVAYQIEGIEPQVHGPFFGLLRDDYEKAGSGVIEGEKVKGMVDLTRDLVAHIQREIRTVDFWQDGNSRRQLENWLYTRIRQSRIFPSDRAEVLANRLVDLAYYRRKWLAI
jgi:hypothetical protein